MSVEKKIIKNFFSLSSIQLANYILPLIALPYLVRILGVEKFGLIMFAQAFVQYFVVITDYGFGLFASREISVHRNNSGKVSEIFSSVIFIQFLMMLICLVIFCLVVFLFPKFRNDWVIYVFTSGVILGNVLFPAWFFFGMERMEYMAIRNAFIKGVFTLSIFIFIKSERDYIYVPLINSLGYLCAGAFSARVMLKDFKINLSMPRYDSIKYYLKGGWHIFTSTLSINLCTITNTFVLGLFTNNIIVGYYSAAEKIVTAIVRLFDSFVSAVYPHISQIASESREQAVMKIRKLSRWVFFISLACFLVFFALSKYIITIVLGAGFTESIAIARILSPLLVIIPMSAIFANLTMIPFNMDKYFSRTYIAGALINLALLFLTIYVLDLGSTGAALSSLITQLVLVCIMYMILAERGIKVIKFRGEGRA